jgi:uncharacterized protein YaaN involved in tellurite resistance
MNRDAEDFVQLDIMCGNLLSENKELQEKVKFLESECSALREQVQHLQKQVYNGTTM